MYQNHLILTIYTLYISYLYNHLTSEVMYKIPPSIFYYPLMKLSCKKYIGHYV